MRIGLDCRLPTYRLGGISQYVMQLLPALSLIDNENKFNTFYSRKEKRSFVEKEPANFRRRKLYTPCHHRLERLSLALEIAPHNLDVFHSPDFIPPSFGAKRHVIGHHELVVGLGKPGHKDDLVVLGGILGDKCHL